MIWAGFQPLRHGRIHIYCPKRGRKQSNMPRDEETDPPDAEIAHVFCLRCSDGCKDIELRFLNGRGKQVWSIAEVPDGR